MSAVTEPTLKKCSKCGKWKNRENDFTKKRHVRGHRVYVYPTPECRECNKKRSRAHRAKLKATGQAQAAQERWEANRDTKHRQRRVREWYRMTRGERLHHVWKKYQHETDLGVSPRTLDSVSVHRYLSRFLTEDELSSLEGGRAIRLNGVRVSETDAHRLKRWEKGNPKLLTERQVDEIAIKYDLPPWELVEAGKMVA